MNNIRVKMKNLFAIILAFCVIMMNIPVQAFGYNEQEQEDTEDIISSKVANDSYIPVEENEQSISYKRQVNARGNSDKKVVLIQDTLPWNTNSNEELLNKLGIPYDKVTTQNFLLCDLSQYAVVIFANDQKFSAYENYKEFKEYLEIFAELGGVIIFGAADSGWANGSLSETLPGDIKKTSRYVYYNYIADNTHPIVKGNLSDNELLLDGDLYEKYTSHSCFVENSLPAGSKIILRDSDRNEPTLVEYPLGDGRVIASGLTWEYSYGYAQRGQYARKAFDDLFLYAIEVSSINQHDVTRLREYYLHKTEHTIVVISSDNKEGIKGAKVEVGGNTYITNENGMVGIKEANNLKTTVKVSASGYNNASFNYTIQSQKAHIFILDKDNGNRLPYCTMVEEKAKEYDLLHEKMYYMEEENTVCNLSIGAEWRGKTPKEYVLYQEGELGGKRGISIKQHSSEFNIIPGKTFNPQQPVMLKLVASDGTESMPIQIGIVINKNSKIENGVNANGNLLNETSLTLGESQNGEINDDKISAVFPNNFDFKISSLPINVRGINNSKEGTYTVRMQIGLGRSNYLDDNKKWNTFKEDIDSATKVTDNTNRLAGLMQAYDSQMGIGSFSIVSDWKPYVKGMGYYEQTYDAEGNIVSQGGGVILCGGGKYSNTRQFLAGPVPIYINLSGAVELNTTQGLKYGSKGFEYVGKINIMPSISLSGGLGIKGVASVGVGGKALMNIQIQPDSKAEITLSAFIEASLIFVFNYSYDIGKTTIPLWPVQNSKKMSLARYLSENAPDINMSDMEYTQQTTDWNQSVIEKNKIVSLQDWILPGTIPLIEQINNKTILIFQSTDSSKEQINSTVLMYSIYENGYFSIPQPVCISDSADLFASTVSYNDNLYLVWQKQMLVTTDDNTNIMLADALSKTEIYFSKWNNETNQFDDVTAITNNNTMDMLPRLAVNNNEISVIWVNNSANNPYGLDGEYSVMKSVYSNNTWSEPQKLYCTNEFISEIAVGYDDSGELNVAFTSYNAEQQDFSEVYILNNSGLSKITENESEESGLQFFENSVYWECDGLINEYNLSQKIINNIVLQDCVVDSSFKIIKSGSKTAICWSNGQAIKASVRINGQWSKEIELYDSDGKTINNMDALLMSDGSWLNVMNMREEDGKTSIYVLNSDIKSDISLDYVFASDVKRNDGMQPFEFAVTNNGENTLRKLNVSIESEGVVYLDKEINCNIAPGETHIFIDEFELSSLNKVTDFNLKIDNENDMSCDNNVKLFQLGLTDISISVNQYVADNDIVIAVNVSNLSETSSQTTISIIEDNEDGIVLDMKNIGTIEGQDEILYLYSISKNSIDFTDKNVKYYYIKADTIIEDYSSSNNSKLVVVYPESEITPSDEEMIEMELVNVTGIDIDTQDITLILSDESRDTMSLSAIVFPQNATYQDVEWSVDDESIAEIDENGTISAVSEGNTIVRVTSVDGGFSASTSVTVKNEESENIINIYFSNNKNWSNVYAYCFKSGTDPVTENKSWPGVLMNYKTQNMYNEQVYEIQVDANTYDYIVFSDGGSQQTVDIPITGIDNIGYYITDNLNNKYNVESYNYSEETQTIYFTDNYNWGNIHAYCFKSKNGILVENQSWPGKQMTYVSTNGYGEKIYAITIPKDKYDYIIFSNGSNSKQTIDISLNVLQNTGFYISGNSGNKYTVSKYTFY